jgi:hypothetical protein
MKEVLYLAIEFHRLILMYNYFLMTNEKKKMYSVWVVDNHNMNNSPKKETENYPKMNTYFLMRMMYLISKIYYMNKLMDNHNYN